MENHALFLEVYSPDAIIGNPNSNRGLPAMPRLSKYATAYDLFAYAQDNRPSIVYLATNVLNGKRYIGMTRNTLARRQGQHIAQALRGACKFSIFHKAIRKYGAAAFRFEILAQCESYKAAAIEEIRLIAESRPEYNLGMGGEAVPNVGTRPTAAARKATSLRMKGKPSHWLGKKRPDIAEMQRRRLTGRADLMRALHAKAHTPDSWAKISATKRARGPSPQHLAAMVRRRKPLMCIDDGRVFGCCDEAARAIGCRSDSLRRVLNGQREAVFGYRFKYVETDTT